MEFLPSQAIWALPTTALLLLTQLWVRVRSRSNQSRAVPQDALDTIPALAKILADGDRAAAQAAIDEANEPVPSAFFEDCEVVLPGRR